jgi:large subunit ribosomal protein L10
MAITKAKKAELVEVLDEKLKGAESIVFVQFKKLSVKDTMAMRRALRASGVGYKVIKKTLMKRVLSGKGITGEMPELAGEIGLAYGQDLTAPAREVYAFSQTRKEQVAIVGGVFEGKFMNQSEMLSIATIPPLQVLYGQFVGMLASPMRTFVVALDQIAQKKQA